MRKEQKQQAEEFVRLMGQAHDEIKKAIEKKNISTVFLIFPRFIPHPAAPPAALLSD